MWTGVYGNIRIQISAFFLFAFFSKPNSPSNYLIFSICLQPRDGNLCNLQLYCNLLVLTCSHSLAQKRQARSQFGLTPIAHAEQVAIWAASSASGCVPGHCAQQFCLAPNVVS